MEINRQKTPEKYYITNEDINSYLVEKNIKKGILCDHEQKKNNHHLHWNLLSLQ